MVNFGSNTLISVCNFQLSCCYFQLLYWSIFLGGSVFRVYYNISSLGGSYTSLIKRPSLLPQTLVLFCFVFPAISSISFMSLLREIIQIGRSWSCSHKSICYSYHVFWFPVVILHYWLCQIKLYSGKLDFILTYFYFNIIFYIYI